MSARIYVVGTGTGVGKTALVCALLTEARVRGLPVVPFKPVQSGTDAPSDAERLSAASPLPLSQPEICPLRFDPPLAPGLAERPEPFFRRPRPSVTSAVPSVVTSALAHLEKTYRPQVVLVEGAGGLHVPMPGGTWQPTWIRLLAPRTIVVGDADLGTINHCLLTIDALVDLGCPPIGFYLSETRAAPDPSRCHNAGVIAAARNLPHLGTLRYRTSEDEIQEGLLRPLMERL